EDTWTALKTAFDVPSSAAIFADVKTAMAFKLSGTRDPLPEIMHLNEIFERLAINKVDIPIPLRCMILLAGIPNNWDTLASNILASTKTASLVFSDIHDQIHNEYERRSGRALPKNSSANKISAVKRKGQDPKYKTQQEKPEQSAESKDSPAEKSRFKKPRGGKRWQNKGKGKAKAVEFNDSGSSEIDFAGMVTGEYLSAMDINSDSTPQPPTTSSGSLQAGSTSAQSYTGIMPGTLSIFPSVNSSRSLVSRLSVPTTLENLRTLEHVHSRVYPGDVLISPPLQRSAGETKTRNPRKKRKVSEMDKRDDDTVSLGSLGDMDTEVPADWQLDDEPAFGTINEWSVNLATTVAVSNVATQSNSLQSLRHADVVKISSIYVYNVIANEEHFACCASCKKSKGKGHNDSHVHWIMDSGASLHFTNDLNDYAEYTLGSYGIAQTASSVVKITAVGTVFLAHNVFRQGKKEVQMTRIYPVYYFVELKTHLLSMGTLLQDGLLLRGSSEEIVFKEGNRTVLSCKPRTPQQTIFWMSTRVISDASLVAVPVIYIADHEIWHKRLGHPSKEVLRKCPEHLEGFPKNLKIDHSLCPGCLKGKMASKPFPASTSCATKPFELVHTDLKEFPVQSYHKYKWIVTFFDDYTSHGWTIC